MKIRYIIISALLALTVAGIQAQEKPKEWNLTNCIEYALQNNIQIQKSKISLESSVVSTQQAKAQLLPNLSASANQNFSTRPFQVSGGSSSAVTNSTSIVSGSAANTYSGSYGLSSSMTLYDGGKIRKNILQQKLSEEASQCAVLEAGKSIQLSILQTYLQILYANETVATNKATADVSKYQLERGQNLLKAGSISKADLAQLESQYSSDKYQLVVSENSLSSEKLALKQLLELGADEELNIVIPELTSVDVLKPLQSLQSVYTASLNVMPQYKSSKLNIKIAGLETEKAKAGYSPTVSLNASAGANHNSLSTLNFGHQLQDGLNGSFGLSVSLPILDRRETKSSIEKAVLNEKNTKLSLLETEKSLMKEIESAYQDALSAQSQFMAATEKVKALQTSYELIEQQYNLGMKNTLELLTEKNNLLSAQQSMLQAKYLSIMNMQTLNLYQDLPLEIK